MYSVHRHLGQIQDFREGGSRYRLPKVVPCGGSGDIVPPENFKNFGPQKWDL